MAIVPSIAWLKIHPIELPKNMFLVYVLRSVSKGMKANSMGVGGS